MNQTLKWVSKKEAQEWPTGIAVLVHRPDSKQTHSGYYEICCYFRPDWVQKNEYYEQGDKTFYAKL